MNNLYTIVCAQNKQNNNKEKQISQARLSLLPNEIELQIDEDKNLQALRQQVVALKERSKITLKYY